MSKKFITEVADSNLMKQDALIQKNAESKENLRSEALKFKLNEDNKKAKSKKS